MKTVAIILCRLNSLRLPAKALLDLGGKPIIDRVIEQVQKCKLVDEICLASTEKEEDIILKEHIWTYYPFMEENGVHFYEGESEDVLSRFYKCAQWCRADIVVRVNGDSPFTEPAYIDGAIAVMKRRTNKWVEMIDYVTFDKIPFGMQSWVFTYKALERLNKLALHSSLREHVTGLLDVPLLFNKLCYPLKPHQHKSIAVDDLDSYVQACQIFRKRQHENL